MMATSPLVSACPSPMSAGWRSGCSSPISANRSAAFAGLALSASISTARRFVSPSATSPEITPSSLRRVLTASSLGTLFEWYDFYLYGSLVLFFGELFFPPGNERAAMLSSLAACFLVAAGDYMEGRGEVVKTAKEEAARITGQELPKDKKKAPGAAE